MKTTIDHVAALDLEIYAINNYDIYHKLYVPICVNLERKIKKNVFNPTKALKAFAYCAEAAAKAYHKELCSLNTAWYRIFDKATREETAKLMLNDFLADRA